MPYRLIHSWRRALWQIPAILLVAGIVALSVNALRQEPLPLVGDWSVDAQMTTVDGDRLDISIDDAVRLFQNQTAVFIDARPAVDYERGHIEGALNLPWQDVDRLFPSVAAELPPEKQIVTYCDGETCNLSHDLAVFLRDVGFVNTRVLLNGWTRWEKAGLPFATGESLLKKIQPE